MKRFITSFLLLAGLATVSSCKKDDTTTTNTMAVSGDLKGDNQVPAVSTSASGNVTGTYDKNTKALNYTVTFKDLTGPAIAGHFHIAPPGQANPTPEEPIAIPSAASGSVTGTTTKASVIAALMAGNLYVNIHTAANKGGEIRANLVAK